jgi:4-amino-4-deoxy-L-arabinose transferase-like glycosyltransferase
MRNGCWEIGPATTDASEIPGEAAPVSRAVVAIAAAVVILLIAFASRYGYHRDELYFIAAGHHLAWAYADQGPLTPLIARAMTEIAPDSLTVLRLPSALAAGATVLLTGLLARELAGSSRAQVIAAASAATAVIVLFGGHLLSTSTFDLLAWTAITWLVVRAVRSGDDRLWLVAGVVLGVGLLNKPLPAFLAVGLLAGVALAGPRRLLRNPYVWLGGAIAVALFSPWLIWQANHGWPQLDVARSIAEGHSGSSEPWWAVVPFQFLLISPLLAPVWIAGLVRLFRNRELRDFRFLAWAWVILVVGFMVTGGKPYYISGLMPALLAAGSATVDAWVDRGRRVGRRVVLAVVFAVSAVIAVLISLPIVPAKDAGQANSEVRETIGWPAFARTVADVYGNLNVRRGAVIFTSNYGEAGAIDLFGPGLGLPQAYSGHNAFGEWGPPPNGSAPVIAVGLGEAETTTDFLDCRLAARIDNGLGIENDEQGAGVYVCGAPRRTWSAEWPSLEHLG